MKIENKMAVRRFRTAEVALSGHLLGTGEKSWWQEYSVVIDKHVRELLGLEKKEY